MNNSDVENSVNKETFELLRTLIRLGKVVEVRLDGLLGQTSLTSTKLFTLDQLGQSCESLSLSKLAVCLAFVKSNATQLVDSLEREQLVKRVPDSNDRRSTLLALTEEGKQRQEIGLETIQPLVERIETIYTPAERVQLQMLLQRLGKAFA